MNFSFTNHPVAFSQVTADRMSQIIDGRDLCEYRGKSLRSSIHQRSVARNVVAAIAIAHVTLFIVTTIDASIQIVQIQFGGNRFQFVQFFTILSTERGHQFLKLRELWPSFPIQ